ncbi:hypothetical protein NDU88_002549 [Pleurodeles waltl]|uniref:Uncharacterized protein n=1 Tax=Pleurodeles waltl TaxID=8319 RepID=A0AAV7TLK2_PLEWA|nr:hypothetical protein NDU88_002549 [Pleurodeles waltl]
MLGVGCGVARSSAAALPTTSFPGGVPVPLHSPQGLLHSPSASLVPAALHGRGGEAALRNVSQLSRSTRCSRGPAVTGQRQQLTKGRVPKTTLHNNIHSYHEGNAQKGIQYSSTRDCSTPQPKRTGERAAHPTADRMLKDEEQLPDQVAAQARQVRLEDRDSIVRFLHRTATGSPEWAREYVRPHATGEEVDSQTSTERQNPTHVTNSPDTSTEINIPIRGTRAHRSH